METTGERDGLRAGQSGWTELEQELYIYKLGEFLAYWTACSSRDREVRVRILRQSTTNLSPVDSAANEYLGLSRPRGKVWERSGDLPYPCGSS